MKGEVLLSKIVANATETTWSQAYSTLNLYVVISLERDDGKKTIATLGKDVLEKIQREFFAVDEKNLESIKSSVENVVKAIEEYVSYSIIVATIIKDILYIVVAGEGYVVVKRGDKIGIVAEGEKGKIQSFSGPLIDNDSVILETADFYKKISVDKFSSLLDTLDILDTAENLAPLIHGNSHGTEASIILKYKQIESLDQEIFPLDDQEEDDIFEKAEEEEKNPEETRKKSLKIKGIVNKMQNILPLKLNLKKLPLQLPKAHIKGKKTIILFCIIVLIAVLGVSLFFEKNRQQQQAQEQTLKTIIDPAQKKYSEALSILSLNKSLASSELLEAQKILNDGRNKFKEGTDERKKIESLLSEVNSKITDLEQGTQVATEVVFDGQKDDNVKSVELVSFKGDSLVVVNQSDGIILLFSSKGALQKTIKTQVEDVRFATSDKSYVYFLSGSGIYRLDKGKTKPEKIVSKATEDTVGIDNFLGNVYALNSEENDVEKYASSGFSKSSYFVNDVDFPSQPVSFSIDSSIWILQADGKIRKFTKGKEEEFLIKGLITPFGSNLSIYTDKGMSNVYVLDRNNSRIVSIAKNSGDYVNSYKWDLLSKADSFAIDETNKKGYVVVDDKLYSFELQ